MGYGIFGENQTSCAEEIATLGISPDLVLKLIDTGEMYDKH